MRKALLAGTISIIVVSMIGVVFLLLHPTATPSVLSGRKTATDNEFSRNYSAGKCKGTGTVPFTHAPMNSEDIGMIQPYGLIADAHVIPTSHGYISPAVFNSPRDAYPVYAIADGTIVHISHRGEFIGDKKPEKKTDEYQLYIEYSCTFYSYYDLLTSLSPDIAAQVGQLSGFEQRLVRIPIKAGQLIGRVGGQTVDFAVWNFEQEPAFFANPKSYKNDENRFYLEDMFKYFVEPIKTQLLAKNIRGAPPRTGKVNFDVEGTLLGNWFQEISGGFSGPPGSQSPGKHYWDGHLAIVYDFIDPTQIRISTGNYAGRAAQFAVKGNSPDPTAVTPATGMMKYELQHWEYFDAKTGMSWQHGKNPEGSLTARNIGPLQGTVLLQLTDAHKLKAEFFPSQAAATITGFTPQARTYVR